jgi:hypothetical protein
LSLPDDPTTTLDRDDTDWYEPIEEDLPPRPRRRLATPATLVLAAVIIGAGGFFAGVKVQKSQGSTASGATLAGAGSGFPGRPGGGGPAGGGAAGGGPAGGGGSGGPAATGTVANKHGSTLYVSTPDGTTVKVQVNKNAKVSRTATTGSKGIYPGDTVVVQGTKSKDGSVSATQVNATAKGASAGGFGGFGGFGGGGGGGGARPGGATPPGG